MKQIQVAEDMIDRPWYAAPEAVPDSQSASAALCFDRCLTLPESLEDVAMPAGVLISEFGGHRLRTDARFAPFTSVEEAIDDSPVSASVEPDLPVANQTRPKPET